MKKTREQKGITLIALVITIVVLLILAVVAINSIKDEGLIAKTEEATEKYNQSVQNEADRLNEYLQFLNKYNGEGSDEQEEPEGPKTYLTYAEGQEVILTNGNEKFYVVADEGENAGTVTVITKFCINTEDPNNIVQSEDDPTGMAFSETMYWVDESGNVLLENLIEQGEPDESHYAARAAYDYAKQIGAGETGRLMHELPRGSSLGEGILKNEYFQENMFCWSTRFATDIPEAIEMIGRDSDSNVSDNFLAPWFSSSYVRPMLDISKDLIKSVE